MYTAENMSGKEKMAVQESAVCFITGLVIAAIVFLALAMTRTTSDPAAFLIGAVAGYIVARLARPLIAKAVWRL